MPERLRGLSSADRMKRPSLLFPVLLAAIASAAAAQTATPTPTRTPTVTTTPQITPTPTPGLPTTVASGATYTTENSARVSGVRVTVDASGGIWFLESGTDRLGVLRGTSITYWTLRSSDNIGANPVDFRL